MFFTKLKNQLVELRNTIFCVLFSGLCWYISNGLNGEYWYLLWLAPAPIIVLSYKTTSKQIFFISFFAYLIGRLSWFNYLLDVATLIPALLFTIALPLIFAIIITLTKSVNSKISARYAVFVFPVLFTAFEWLLTRFSADGSVGSIAYSQSDFLPLIQVASVTGVLGITFMVTFIPSALAMAWHFRHEKEKLLLLSFIASGLIGVVFLFGFSRIAGIPESKKVTVGLVVLEENEHKMGSLDLENEIEHVKKYTQEIGKLAARGAKIVVLPERAINISQESDTIIDAILRVCAKQNNVTIVTGYTNFKKEKAHNSACVIDEQGDVKLEYNKKYLVTVLEDEFVPGNMSASFAFGDCQVGIAICKDLDFPYYIREYSIHKPVFLCIPAWDFVVDDWLHSRMAILRGVENGFSEIRTARLGRLTISDSYGRINAEENSANSKANSLLGQVSLGRTDTLYAQYGDWFGVIIFIISIAFISRSFIKKSQPKSSENLLPASSVLRSAKLD